ncbi:TetR/AcrR family transcriptional regulator [Sporosarcina sp. YIM B06819]|uniref:TetR/AcrR family transcriptional regulator n=1 Tax=Sporosarcina sp. YIM B06819 TaxID=3081769 RepID=UPI00298BF082|nr:TetR/AcrR family transcriptional regulator [Sporosarcina sp. YIM B06819]
MITQKNKQTRGKKTQKRILETALKLFTEKGYDKVTVEDICEKSGSSKGSFYQHFTSKSTIFLVKFFEVDDYYTQVIETMPEGIDVYEKITIFFHEAMCFINDHMGKDLMKIIYSSAPLSKEHTYFLNKDRELTRIFISFAEEIQRTQPIDSTSQIENLLMMMNQTMMGAIYYWSISQDDRSLPDSAHYITDTMIRGLKGLN